MLGRIVPLHITSRLEFVACLSRFTIALFNTMQFPYAVQCCLLFTYSDTVPQNEGNWLCFDMPLFNQLSIRRPFKYRTECVFLAGFRDIVLCST